MAARAIMSAAVWEKISVVMIAGLMFGYWVPSWVGNYQESKRVEAELAAIDPQNFLVVDNVFVNDATVGEEPIMLIDSMVKQAFPGEYSVVIKDALTRTAVCTAGDSIPYKPRNEPLPPKTISWWANDGECKGSDLPAGAYFVDTQWTIHHGVPGYAPTYVDATSNVFNVYEDDLQEKIQQLEQEVQELRALD